VSLWLSEQGTPLTLTIANRNRQLHKLLNDRDVVSVEINLKGEKCLVGVEKHKSFCHFLEQREPLGQIQATINMDYNSRENCELAYYYDDRGRGAAFMACLWEVVRPNVGNDEYSFVVRAN
jgi:hypothetical protein